MHEGHNICTQRRRQKYLDIDAVPLARLQSLDVIGGGGVTLQNKNINNDTSCPGYAINNVLGGTSIPRGMMDPTPKRSVLHDSQS